MTAVPPMGDPMNTPAFSFGEMPLRTGTSRRMRAIGSLLIALVVAGLAVFVLGELDHQLARSAEPESDNRIWTLAQVEVDLQRLQIALLEAQLPGADSTALKRVSDDFDILFSRVALMQTANSMDSLSIRRTAGWQRLAGPGGLVPVMADLLDNHAASLPGQLAVLETRTERLLPEVRRAVTGALATASDESDAMRRDLRASLQIFSGALIAIMGVLALLLLLIYLQGRSLARHAKMLERAVRSQNAMIEAAHDCVLLIDADGSMRAVNRLGGEALGLPPGNPGRPRLSDHLPPEVAVLDHCERRQTECRRADGSRFPVELTIVSSALPIGRAFRIAFLRDMTEQMEREGRLSTALAAARQGEEAKARFLAVMSHEMRTPLNGLLSAVELLESTTGLDAEQEWLVEIMRGCGHATLEQVNNVLELTQLASTENGSYATSAFDLRELLQVQVQQFQAGAVLRGNALCLDAPPEGPRVVLRAPLQLVRRVLNNLLSNAVKFTEGGRIALDFAVAPTDRPGRRTCRISVRDSGMGIDAADLQRIFHNFETLDSSYSRMQEGSGLGLGIAKLAAEALGGRIEVESAPGRGSCFTLVFQADLAEPVATALHTAVAQRGAEGQLRILLAEDNEINRTLLIRQLERFGHDVVAVGNGEEAVEAVRLDEPFDAVLMDVSMPRMDGVTATRLLRAGEVGRHLPIIALTAQADRERIAQFRAAGMNEVITKPVATAELLAAINRVAVATATGLALPAAAAPPGLAAAEAPLDARAILETVEDMGPDFLRGLVARFAAEIAEAAPLLAAALARGDGEAVQHLAHRGAGSAAVLGFSALARSLRAIENQARDLGPAAAAGPIAELPGLVAESLAAFETLLAAAPA